MIIRIIATALIQCTTRTQAGWMIFAGTEIVRCSVAVMLDMDVHPNWYLTIRQKLRSVTAIEGIKSIETRHRGHNKRARRVGKAVGCAASGGVPTIDGVVGTAQGRLCPPYASARVTTPASTRCRRRG